MNQQPLRKLAKAARASAEGDFLLTLLSAWAGTLPGDFYSLVRHSTRHGTLDFWHPGSGPLGPDHWQRRLFAKFLAAEKTMAKHPSVAAFLQDGPGAYLRSNLLPDKTWRRREHYRLIDRVFGVKDMVCLFLEPSEGVLLTLHAGTKGANYSPSVTDLAADFASLANALVRARGGLEERPLGDGSDLSPREREILGWVKNGKRNAEVAAILGISPLTVRKHLENVFAKLGVETRTAAVAALKYPAAGQSNPRFFGEK
jgi:DNA-binding CsgD family transcriptional regulator